MSEKLNVPADIFPGNKQYSWRTDWAINRWLLVATVISAFADVIFRNATAQWPLVGRTAIVLVQFLALLLWSRSLARWIRGMDEMHQRITIASVLVAVGATFFFLLLWHRLDAAGLFRACFPSQNPHGTWDIGTVGYAALLLTLFYSIAFRGFNRRYQ
jgi:hypothetical protein